MENQTTAMAPPPGPPPFHAAIDAQQQVSGPAIGLIVTAIIGIVLQTLMVFINIFFIGLLSRFQEMQPSQGPEGFETFSRFFTGAFAVAGFLFTLIVGILMIFAGIRMKKLQSWGLAVTASILAMIPCLSPCCINLIIGLPIGIWALVILMKPEVKAAFK